MLNIIDSDWFNSSFSKELKGCDREHAYFDGIIDDAEQEAYY